MPNSRPCLFFAEGNFLFDFIKEEGRTTKNSLENADCGLSHQEDLWIGQG